MKHLYKISKAAATLATRGQQLEGNHVEKKVSAKEAGKAAATLDTAHKKKHKGKK